MEVNLQQSHLCYHNLHFPPLFRCNPGAYHATHSDCREACFVFVQISSLCVCVLFVMCVR